MMNLNIRKPTQSLLLDTLKWMLCFLILIAVGLSIGCQSDEEDLSDKYLVIWRMHIDKQELDIKQTAKLSVDCEYSGDEAELQYTWTAELGTIHNNGRYATYVAPENADIDVIRSDVSNGVITVSDAISVTVGNPCSTKETDTKPETATKTEDSNDSETNQPAQPDE